MVIHLIEVPSHAGDDRHPSSAGPGRLVEAGAAALEVLGHRVTREVIDAGVPFRDTASSSAAVNRKVARSVSGTVAAHRFPFVLAGSCAVAHGVLGGFDHRDTGIVWIDAHADFNTPETTISGFFPGMSLAVIVGDCYRSYWADIGDNTPVPEEAIALFGVRALSPEAERDRLERSSLQVVAWRNGRPQRDIRVALDELASRVGEVYLHVDLDGFAPEIAPGVVDTPVPGGLSMGDAEAILLGVADRFRVRAATIATFNPDRDRGNITSQLAVQLIRLIGDAATPRRDLESDTRDLHGSG
jgi:arginase